MKAFFKYFCLLALVFTANTALARKPHPPPTPVPINLMNVVTVSAENGNYTSPVEAMNSITDAMADNPYLIQIGPGVYDIGTEQILMKSWIAIQGADKNATIITGANTTGALIIGADDAVLMDLTVHNKGGGAYSYAIYNEDASPTIKRVKAVASDGYEENIAIHNISSSPTMTFVTAVALDGLTYNIGVLNRDASSPKMNNVYATAHSAEGEINSGVYNYISSSPTMINNSVSASGAKHNFGVFNHTDCSPTITGVITSASGGTWNFGMNSSDNSSPFIQDSILEGESVGVFISENSPGTRVVNSKIINGFYNNADGSQCRGNYDENLADVDCLTSP